MVGVKKLIAPYEALLDKINDAVTLAMEPLTEQLREKTQLPDDALRTTGKQQGEILMLKSRLDGLEKARRARVPSDALITP